MDASEHPCVGVCAPSGVKGAVLGDNDGAQSLALCSIANITGLELIQSLHVEVHHILVSKSSTPNVRKKAALCLLCLLCMILYTSSQKQKGDLSLSTIEMQPVQ
eukprot:9684722-Ditylum_brightwellii.AAC.1